MALEAFDLTFGTSPSTLWFIQSTPLFNSQASVRNFEIIGVENRALK